MIDATKSPVPAWKRYAFIALLAVLVVVAAYQIWTKELHPTSSGTSNGAAATSTSATTVAAPSVGKAVTPTTIGIPLSSRSPFGS